MRVGGNHSWLYERGEWEETKVTPDKWQFTYVVKKRRKWDAPDGSGAPTGTEYHWYILAHQKVRKLNANEYTTSMMGVKYKLAHRRAGNVQWSASEMAQLRQLIAILEENIAQLKHEAGAEGRLTHYDVGPSAPTNLRRRETTGGRRVPANSLAPSMLSQLSLETYVSQTGAPGVTIGVSPSVDSSSSSSSKSEFFPKNNR